MNTIASQITSLTIVYLTVNSGTSKKTSKLRVTGLCEGNSPETGEFPAQRASNAENVPIWWRHQGVGWFVRYTWSEACGLRPGSWQNCLGIGYHVPVFCTDPNLYNKYTVYCIQYTLHKYTCPSSQRTTCGISHESVFGHLLFCYTSMLWPMYPKLYCYG